MKKNLEEVYNEFITQQKAKKLTQETIYHHERAQDMFVKFLNEKHIKKSFTQLNQDDWTNFMIWLDNGNRKPITINTYLRGLRSLVRYSYLKYGAPRIQTKLLYAPQSCKSVYSDTELRRLVNVPYAGSSFTEVRNWAMTSLLLYSGLRVNSIVNLKLSDICFESKTLTVSVMKNRKVTVLPLTDKIISVLKYYLEYRADLLYCRDGECEYLFITKLCGRMRRRGLYHSLCDYNRSRNVMRTGIHIFRNTFARLMLVNGADAFTLKHWLCHSTMNMTMQYVNLFAQDLAKTVTLYNPYENLK